MGYPAATRRRTSRINATTLARGRFLRKFAAPDGRRFQLSFIRDGLLVYFSVWERCIVYVSVYKRRVDEAEPSL